MTTPLPAPAPGTARSDRVLRRPGALRDAPGVVPTAVAALVYLVALFATPPDGPPVETATAAQIRAYLEADGTAVRVQALALAVAGVAVVILSAGLATLLTRHPHRPTDVSRSVGNLPALTLGGGLLVAGWHWLTAATEASTAVQALDGTSLATVDDAVLRSWYATTNVTHLYGDIAMLAVATLLTGACLGALRTGLLPRWIAVLGLLAAAAGAVGTVGVVLAVPALANVWFGGLFGWTLWLPCAAVGLVVRARRTQPAAP